MIITEESCTEITYSYYILLSNLYIWTFFFAPFFQTIACETPSLLIYSNPLSKERDFFQNIKTTYGLLILLNAFVSVFKYEALRYALTQAKKNIIDPEIKIK